MLVPIQQRRLDELLLLRARERLRLLELQAAMAGQSLQTLLVEIDLDQSPASERLSKIRTRLVLDEEEVNLLVSEGRKLLNARATQLLAFWNTKRPP